MCRAASSAASASGSGSTGSGSTGSAGSGSSGGSGGAGAAPFIPLAVTPSKPLPAALNGENVLVTVETGRTEGPVLTVPLAAIVVAVPVLTAAALIRRPDPAARLRTTEAA